LTAIVQELYTRAFEPHVQVPPGNQSLTECYTSNRHTKSRAALIDHSSSIGVEACGMRGSVMGFWLMFIEPVVLGPVDFPSIRCDKLHGLGDLRADTASGTLLRT
jgi:hypothetical protein